MAAAAREVVDRDFRNLGDVIRAPPRVPPGSREQFGGRLAISRVTNSLANAKRPNKNWEKFAGGSGGVQTWRPSIDEDWADAQYLRDEVLAARKGRKGRKPPRFETECQIRGFKSDEVFESM
jgi:hypothetical protein